MGASVAPRIKTKNNGILATHKTRKKVKRLNGNSIQSFFTSSNGRHNLKLDENIYNCLNIESTNKKPPKQLPKENRTSKPPPLVVTDQQSKIDKILLENGINKFNLKIMTIGTKVILDNSEDYDKISTHLNNAKIDHFSYASKDKKLRKVVLSGLPVMDIELIKSELNSLNIQPELIIQMKTRNPNPHRALYLIHINSQQITFADLQNIKSISRTIVRWSQYRPKHNGPTQCRNCAMYGHGTSNCHRKPTCSLCANTEHNQSSCPLNNLPQDASPMYKCSYCVKNNLQNVNHKANDPKCPARMAYSNARRNVATRQVDEKSKQSARQQYNVPMIPAPSPPPITRSFRDAVTQGSTSPVTENEDLFTTTQLLQIFTNAVHDIKKCRTKLDQIQVITNLLSYVV